MLASCKPRVKCGSYDHHMGRLKVVPAALAKRALSARRLNDYAQSADCLTDIPPGSIQVGFTTDQE
jgi:hypothetical protein